MTDGNNKKDNHHFFEDISNMFGSLMSTGMNSALETRKQAEDWIDERVNGLLDRGDVVRREEFDALRDTVRRLEEQLAKTECSASASSATNE